VSHRSSALPQGGKTTRHHLDTATLLLPAPAFDLGVTVALALSGAVLNDPALTHRLNARRPVLGPLALLAGGGTLHGSCELGHGSTRK
jgi:hypothetical protein